jgi:TPR repeat protein
MRLLKLLLILFVCATGPAVAGPYEDAVAAYERGAYATAKRLWGPLAEQGDPDAQYQIGMMSYRGTGVPKD